MSLSRRTLLQLAALPLLVPRRAFAAAPERKFLFLFTDGGWDPTWALYPAYDSAGIEGNPDGEAGEVGGIPYVLSPRLGTVDRFFRAYADRTCMIHGLEVRSVTHERCKRLLLTGTSATDADDWPSQIAAESSGLLLPHLVVSGPAFTAEHTSAVVRLGSDGQIGRLLDGSALSDAGLDPLADPAAAAVARFRAARARTFAAAAGAGRTRVVAEGLVAAQEQLAEVFAIDDLDLGVVSADSSTADRLALALDCFERGYSRTAIVRHGGEFDVGWDNHSDMDQQNQHYERLFSDLVELCAELDARPGAGGGSLADETTLVVISEMGRAPRLNATAGKDHWTFTSAMLIGAGVAGGRVVGGFDDNLLGRATDLRTGEPSSSGTLLGTAHLGATLLALAGADVPDVIEAALA